MPPLKKKTWDERTIDRLAQRDPGFDVRPCELDGVELGQHDWLIVEAQYDEDGRMLDFKVIECDRRTV